jgi:hypothetical protein
MNVNWWQFCKADGFVADDDGVEVRFDNGRSQKVAVEDRGDAFLLRSIVARQAVVNEVPDAALRAWVRNRSAFLVGFRVDERGRVVGETWIPKAGITNSEFQIVLRHLATESDRFEFQLTGRDYE